MRTLPKIFRSILVFILLFIGSFVPMQIYAGLFSSILGNEVSANTDDTNSVLLVETSENSQNIALLQANISFSQVLKDKKGLKDKEEDLASLAFSGSTNVISGNALIPLASPMVAKGGTEYIGLSSDDVSVYVVKKGDSLSEIAEMFNVSVNTIMWANDIKKSTSIKEDDILFILPVSGIQHIVTKGQTLSGIAKLYKVDVITIRDFNEIGEGDTLSIGDELIIPDAKMPSSAPSSSSSSSSLVYSSSNTLRGVSGYFINPVPQYKRKSQGLHGPGNRGIDLAASTGTQILASASGRVLLARIGYNGGYGNMVIIEHPNGTKTLYAHMSRIITKTGVQVLQREVIGYVGSTGRSTGPHLHFEVFNARNPGTDWSWAN